MTLDGELKLQALDLHVDESKIIHCPFCKATHERSLSITRKESGVVYHCFRASCGVSGFVPSSPGQMHTHREVKKTKPYRGTMIWYDHYHFPFLSERFGIDPVYMDGIAIADEEQHHYLLPVANIYRQGVIGWQLRKFDGSKPKAILYYEDAGPYLQYVPVPNRGLYRSKPTIYVVEDYFSMLKVQEACDRQNLNGKAISILGTHITDELAVWLGKHSKTVRMMLDPDALSKAYKFNKQYGLLWGNSSVVLLDQDPKDTPMDALKEIVTYGT